MRVYAALFIPLTFLSAACGPYQWDNPADDYDESYGTVHNPSGGYGGDYYWEEHRRRQWEHERERERLKNELRAAEEEGRKNDGERGRKGRQARP